MNGPRVNRSSESQPNTDEAISRRRQAWIVMAFAALGCGLAIAPLVWYGDSEMSKQISGIHLPGDLNKAIQVSEVFAHGTGVIAILATLWWIDIERRRSLQFAAGITLISGVTANGMKAIFTRIRPHSGDIVDGSESWLPMFHGSFWESSLRSFPSGHAATAVALAIGLSIVYPRGKFLFASFAFLACFQRIVSKAHYPSDVVVGAFIAVVCCAFCMRWRPGIAAN